MSESTSVSPSDCSGSIDQMAEDIFNLTLMTWRERLASRHGTDLSESQFLTLDLLAKSPSLTVGELQRSIGVLPAQMSRIIRALEDGFEKALIACSLNPDDKRKINVTMTNAGRKVYEEFRETRLAKTKGFLAELSEQDRCDFVRICRQMKALRRGAEAVVTASDSD